MKYSRWIGVCMCLVITLVFCYSILGNLTKPLGLTHNDVYQNMFIIKHVMDVIQSGHWSTLPKLPMFYGFSHSYFYNEPFILHAIAGLPIYIATGNIILTYNLLAVGTMLASLIAVYALAYQLTGKYISSVIAAVVAVVNPFVMARFPDHLNLVTLVFLPLIFLFVERILKRPTPWNCLGLFLLLTAQLLTSFYYAAFLTLILPIYVIVRWIQERTNLKKLFQWGTITGIVVFMVVVVGMVKIYSGTFLFGETAPDLDRQQLLYYSAWPTDWLFAPAQNVLYGAIRPLIAKIFPTLVHQGTPSEEHLFPGMIVLVLWIIAFVKLRKTTYRRFYYLFAVLSGVSFILSFGPVIHLTSNVTVPGVFDIVSTLDPVLRMTRVTARFAVFVFLFGGIIAAMVTTHMRKMFTLVILLFILIEYWIHPFDFLTVPKETLAFYNRLDTYTNIRVILDVPVGDAMLSSGENIRPEYMDAHYLLWAAIAHHKTLLGGYVGYMPIEYYVRANTIATGFPSPETVSLVRKWGVDAVILHEDEYAYPTDYHLAKVKLAAMGMPMIEEINGLALFDLHNL
jgi:hypothetical protein